MTMYNVKGVARSDEPTENYALISVISCCSRQLFSGKALTEKDAPLFFSGVGRDGNSVKRRVNNTFTRHQKHDSK